MRKAIWAVWGHSCSTDDEPIHWFCPTNPNTWCKYNAAINNNLQNYKHKPSVAKAVQDVIKPVFADLSHPALLKKCLGANQYASSGFLPKLGCTQCRFVLWVHEALGVKQGPDKLDLTRFSVYKFQSSSARGPVDLPRPGPGTSLNRVWVYDNKTADTFSRNGHDV
ncbi:uncharacterized protein TNCV_1974741 [Trichonephila clavipes]|nr:uncharacterized protein TNCV_1974741 [Trichonephila clavipes]